MLEKMLFDFSEKEILRCFISDIEKKFPDFKEIKNHYLATIRKLRDAGYNTEELNAALEKRQAADLLFSIHMGLQSNLNRFRTPETYDFLSVSSEHYLRELTMINMPTHIQASNTFADIVADLPDVECAPIFEYTSYLYTTLPRLAHYYG